MNISKKGDYFTGISYLFIKFSTVHGQLRPYAYDNSDLEGNSLKTSLFHPARTIILSEPKGTCPSYQALVSTISTYLQLLDLFYEDSGSRARISSYHGMAFALFTNIGSS